MSQSLNNVLEHALFFGGNIILQNSLQEMLSQILHPKRIGGEILSST